MLIVCLVMQIKSITYAAVVMDVQIEEVTNVSVRVLWERILNIPEITHYTVFYSRAGRQDDLEQYINIAMTEYSVVIRNLSGGAKSYQFVVVAIATVNNTEILGERSIDPVTFPSLIPTSNGGREYIFLFTSLLVSFFVQMSVLENQNMYPLL